MSDFTTFLTYAGFGVIGFVVLVVLWVAPYIVGLLLGLFLRSAWNLLTGGRALAAGVPK